MDINQIVTLLNAGFTADEIRALQSRDVPAPEPEPEPAPAPAPDPAPAPAPAPDQYAEVLSAISALTAAIQANGIAKSSQPELLQKRDDILASIIKPTK